MNKKNTRASLILASLVVLLIFVAPASAAVLQAAFTAEPTTGNAPLVVMFKDKSTGSPSVRMWDFGDGGTSKNVNPSHTYLKPGTYTVTLTITKGSYSSTVSQTINVPGTDPATQHPRAHFTAVNRIGQVPLTVQFKDTSTGSPTAWLWTFGDGTQGNEQNPTHTYAKVGVYTVTLQIWNSQGACGIKFVDYVKVTA